MRFGGFFGLLIGGLLIVSGVLRLVVGRRDIAAVTMSMLSDPQTAVQIPALYRRLEAGDFTDETTYFLTVINFWQDLHQCYDFILIH